MRRCRNDARSTQNLSAAVARAQSLRVALGRIRSFLGRGARHVSCKLRGMRTQVPTNRFTSAQQLIGRIQELGPFEDANDARRALTAALEVLGGVLTADERALVASELPAELAGVLSTAVPHPSADWHEFNRRVAHAEGVRLGRAIEHAEVVCRALSEALVPSTRRRLQQALPQLSRFFELPEDVVPPSHEPHRSSEAPNDLAEGRPGGSLPLASADPRYLAHRHSIARSDDPHGDTKLSSAHGLRQEQDQHTLATGRPGSSRPISGSR
jgi:uncharacterized protein (DUF2267 family)